MPPHHSLTTGHIQIPFYITSILVTLYVRYNTNPYLWKQVATNIDQIKIQSNLYFEHNINHINHWETKVAFTSSCNYILGDLYSWHLLSLEHLVKLSYSEPGIYK